MLGYLQMQTNFQNDLHKFERPVEHSLEATRII